MQCHLLRIWGSRDGIGGACCSRNSHHKRLRRLRPLESHDNFRDRHLGSRTYRPFSTSVDVSGGGNYAVNYAMAREVGTVSGALSISVTALGGPPPNQADIKVSTQLHQEPPGAPKYAPDQLLVKLRSRVSSQAAADLHRQLGTQQIHFIPRIDLAVLRIISGEPLDTVLSRHRASSAIEFAEPNYFRYLAAVPNDQFYPLQWHYPTINLPTAWDRIKGSSLVIVAVIDDGIISGHPDLLGITVQGFNFCDNNFNPE